MRVSEKRRIKPANNPKLKGSFKFITISPRLLSLPLSGTVVGIVVVSGLRWRRRSGRLVLWLPVVREEVVLQRLCEGVDHNLLESAVNVVLIAAVLVEGAFRLDWLNWEVHRHELGVVYIRRICPFKQAPEKRNYQDLFYV